MAVPVKLPLRQSRLVLLLLPISAYANELAKYNGQNGNPAYVAVDGIVYDVINAKSWKNGTHQGLSAGQDLTQAIKSSSHGKSVLSELPVVGKLQN